MKVGMSWPLESSGMRRFAEGLSDLLVIEEKRPLIEEQVTRVLYNLSADRRPTVAGKRDETGAPLLPTSSPLPAAGYPFLVLTFIGWIWTLLKPGR